ncbi:anthranilate phosphoribosyltransferase [Candidatus Margulisiibacteriota bacterium]
MLKDIIKKVVDFKNLERDEASRALNAIMTGGATPSQIACLITALRMKGETIDEISGFAREMRRHATSIKPKQEHLVDTCGTGGDISHTFNISTVSALVAAGAGVPVAKHGNRSVSSKCGSADLLEALGVKIDIEPKKVEACINEIGIGFLYAPLFHEAMKFVMPPRKEIGIRTIFNILGPLTNPASAKRQLLGVFDPELTEVLAGVLRILGVEHALVVHGADGLDEISISAQTRVTELKGMDITTYKMTPEEYGLTRGEKSVLVCRDVGVNRDMAMDVLKGKIKTEPCQITLFNAGAVIYVSGLAKEMKEGIELAKQSIDSGAAYKKLEDLIKFTNK